MKTPTHIVSLSPAMRHLLVELQTWCTADCCKARAFVISSDTVGRWLDGERLNRARELAEEVARIETALPEARGRVALDARGLESVWEVADFRAFWHQFAGAFASAVAARKDPDVDSDIKAY